VPRGVSVRHSAGVVHGCPGSAQCSCGRGVVFSNRASVQSPRNRGGLHTLDALAIDWNAAGRRAKHLAIIITMCLCLIGKRRNVVGKASPQLIFFPIVALIPPANQHAPPPSLIQISKLQAPASRFIHSTSRKRIATQINKVTCHCCRLAAPYSCHTMPLVHSAPRMLYSENIADEMGGHDRARTARLFAVERHLRLLGTSPCLAI
jgi:hypothetical protein